MSNKILRQSGRGDRELYFHQDSDQIVIRKSDLVIYFRDFRDAIIKKPSFEGIILLVSIWVPLFTTDFKALFGLNKDSVYGAYLAFVVIVNMIILIRWSFGIIRPFVVFLNRYWSIFNHWLQKSETDPDRKADEIRSKSLKQ